MLASVEQAGDGFWLGAGCAVLVVAVASFLFRCAPRCSRLVCGATLAAVFHPLLGLACETVGREFVWTAGIGCAVRLGLAYAMPVAAVTTIELVLGLVFVMSAAMGMASTPALLE